MTVAATVKRFLDSHGAAYEVVHHSRALTSMRTAEAAHVPGNTLAKSVVLKDTGGGYLVAVLPSTHRLDLDKLDHSLHRKFDFATEKEIAALFGDCDAGAVPPLGAAYGLDTVLDDSLTTPADVYFEGGDHEELIHMSCEQFRLLMVGVPRHAISHHI